MTLQLIDTTTGAGDTGQAGGNKINAMFAEVYASGSPDIVLQRMKRSAAVAATATRRHNSLPWRSAPAWAASTQYQLGSRVVANGNVYNCDGYGTSATSGSGPSGSGPAKIADGNVNWYYVGPAFATDANAPTLTTGATAPTGQRQYTYSGSFSSPTTGPGWAETFGNSTGSGISPGGGAQGTSDSTGFAFETDATTLTLAQGNYAGNYGPTIEVDGRYLQDGVISQGSSSGTSYYTIVFPRKAVRRISVRNFPSNVTGIQAVYVDPTATVWAPKKDVGDLRAHCVGDSFWVFAYGYDNADIANIPANALGEIGINKFTLDALGGTGFSAGGANSYNSSSRLSAITTANPNIVMVHCSVNDAAVAQGTLQSAVSSWVASVRSALPNVWIIVLGVFSPGGGETAAEGYVRQQLVTLADPRIKFIPGTGDPGGSFLTGTGNIGSVKGDGNADIYLGTDALHPIARGATYAGRRFGQSLSNWLAAL